MTEKLSSEDSSKVSKDKNRAMVLNGSSFAFAWFFVALYILPGSYLTQAVPDASRFFVYGVLLSGVVLSLAEGADLVKAVSSLGRNVAFRVVTVIAALLLSGISVVYTVINEPLVCGACGLCIGVSLVLLWVCSVSSMMQRYSGAKRFLCLLLNLAVGAVIAVVVAFLNPLVALIATVLFSPAALAFTPYPSLREQLETVDGQALDEERPQNINALSQRQREMLSGNNTQGDASAEIRFASAGQDVIKQADEHTAMESSAGSSVAPLTEEQIKQLALGQDQIPPERSGSKRALWREKIKRISDENGLTQREYEVLLYLAKGRDASFIKEQLWVSINTVRTHIMHIYRKLDVHSSRELLDYVDNYPMEEANQKD